MAIATILSLFLLFVGRLASHQQNLSAKQMVCLLSELWELYSVALTMYFQFKASDRYFEFQVEKQSLEKCLEAIAPLPLLLPGCFIHLQV